MYETCGGSDVGGGKNLSLTHYFIYEFRLTPDSVDVLCEEMSSRTFDKEKNKVSARHEKLTFRIVMLRLYIYIYCFFK